ncbi:hypothetical protein [Streptomyces avidinii]|uniref:Uncharacterized protein n=1 Tax=Streptomyces avidinii TaxID=1895 RepID=A0ABS4LFS8_STRAV|nr:hypothetical protein [Streptomyces avidinii]MBP2040982.1 hypothetical protein [Streptomyces avidinii]GGZ05530.1 hypothetical protein GCM10010343_34110 [Streptomyces avidinii]
MIGRNDAARGGNRAGRMRGLLLEASVRRPDGCSHGGNRDSVPGEG